MTFRNFLISITKSLIVLVLVTVIFSAATSDFSGLLTNTFGDVFAHSSPQMQDTAISKIAQGCAAFEQGATANVGSVDLSKIGSSCKSYKEGKINSQEFFMQVVGSAIPQQVSASNIEAVRKYNDAINFINNNTAFSLAIAAILLVILYLLIMNLEMFLLAICAICFSIGIIIILPYLGALAYQRFVGIDTTSMLGMIFGGSAIDFKAIMSVILLMFLRTYTPIIIGIGFGCLAVGIAGKIYGWKLKRQNKKKTNGNDSKEKAENKNNEDESEADDEDHKDRSTKEILDELEEIQKNKKN